VASRRRGSWTPGSQMPGLAAGVTCQGGHDPASRTPARLPAAPKTEMASVGMTVATAPLGFVVTAYVWACSVLVAAHGRPDQPAGIVTRDHRQLPVLAGQHPPGPATPSGAATPRRHRPSGRLPGRPHTPTGTHQGDRAPSSPHARAARLGSAWTLSASVSQKEAASNPGFFNADS
jgi:hypothetical protein